jgi:hypothetical protein
VEKQVKIYTSSFTCDTVIFIEVTVKHFVSPSLMVISRVEPLEFLFTNIHLTRLIGLEFTLISTTLHASEVGENVIQIL